MLKIHILLFLFLVSACATSPTGRKQFILIGDRDINNMGAQSFSEIKKKTPITYDRRTNNYINCIVDKLLPHANSKIKNWEVVVFKDESANAFALPGGKIGVHTGIIKVANTDAQLAAVIGHEIGHVTARHGAEKVSSAMAAQLGLATLQIMTEGNDKQQLYLMGAQMLTQFTLLLPHGRQQESESDEIGLILMAKAGFDPRESVKLWENMEKSGGNGPPEFLSTHPSHNNRIKNLQANMPRALEFYNASVKNRCSL